MFLIRLEHFGREFSPEKHEKTWKTTTSFTRKTPAKSRKTPAKTRKRPQIPKSRSITFWGNSLFHSLMGNELDYRSIIRSFDSMHYWVESEACRIHKLLEIMQCWLLYHIGVSFWNYDSGVAKFLICSRGVFLEACLGWHGRGFESKPLSFLHGGNVSSKCHGKPCAFRFIHWSVLTAARHEILNDIDQKYIMDQNGASVI